ncbi:MAG: YidC/Oxa1 family membrane protein insertase [Anaerovoracaceae bacterium]|jgi:YidC/Oxa1 family membrane protein insertase
MNAIIGIIANPLGMLLSLLYGFIDSYGITLIVFTIIVKGVLFPLYASQIKHSAKMADLQPKMKELQRKYANDKETLNIKMMELYKEEKFNPARGCLPMLIQMPIILGLFALLRNPTTFIDSNEMLMAIHEAFVWIPDLSQPDPWILPIAAGLATFISFSLTQKSTQTAEVASMGSMMKMMRYFFPIMIVWMARSFPAGLALYWFVSSVFQIIQTMSLNVWKDKKLAQKGKN